MTLPPASRQTRAAALSRAKPLRPNTPETAQADRWWPKASSGWPHRQADEDRGRGRQRRRRRSARNADASNLNRGDVGEASNGTPAIGPDWDHRLLGVRQAWHKTMSEEAILNCLACEELPSVSRHTWLAVSFWAVGAQTIGNLDPRGGNVTEMGAFRTARQLSNKTINRATAGCRFWRVYMKIGGQIPWNVTPVCKTSQIYYLMGRRRFGQQFKGPIVPFGSLVECHPITAKDQSRIHQFGKKVLPGLFIGYALHVGGLWKGDVLIADLGELEMGASEIHSKRLNAQEVIFPKEGEFTFPIADGRIKPLGGDQDLRTSTLARHRPIQGELGESDGSLPQPQDSFRMPVKL